MFSYAFLGPLHYLTEISWLHDKQYFLPKKSDGYILWVGSFFLLLSIIFKEYKVDALVVDIFFIAFVLSFFKKLSHRIILSLFLLLLHFGILSTYENFRLFSMLLPTLIHVFLFTILFMLFGAKKAKDKFGAFNGILFMLLGASFLMELPISNFQTNFSSQFKLLFGVYRPSVNLFGESMKLENVIRLLAFAYTYHYFNWFSKTKIINWHQISKVRMSSILFIYFLMIGIYLYDYKMGLKFALFLSVIHVYLEFPLNWRCIKELSFK